MEFPGNCQNIINPRIREILFWGHVGVIMKTVYFPTLSSVGIILKSDTVEVSIISLKFMTSLI